MTESYRAGGDVHKARLRAHGEAPGGHEPGSLAYCGGALSAGWRAIHSLAVVISSSTSGRGSTPRPGPVGTFRWPSLRTNGSVMSVAK